MNKRLKISFYILLFCLSACKKDKISDEKHKVHSVEIIASSTQLAIGEELEQKCLPAEIKPNLFHKKGALGAGRDDNAGKGSYFSQIYLVIR